MKMKEVEINVDLNHREKLRRLHTATHIVNYSARKVLGNHVWQNGSNLKAEFGTLDITHYDNLSEKEIYEIEKIANETIFENKKVQVEELDRGDAEKKYGFVLYQGGAIPMKKLRIIHVFDSDIEACGGIHMQYTGGIGIVKIIDATKIQDGVIRLKYVVRDYALDFISDRQAILNEACSVFTVSPTQLPKTCEKFFNEWKEQKKDIEKLKNQLKTSYIEQIISSRKKSFLISGDWDMGFLLDIFNSVVNEIPSFKLESEKFIFATNDLKVEKFKKQIPKGKFNIYVM